MKCVLFFLLLLAGCTRYHDPAPQPDTSVDTEFICVTDSTQAP